MTLVHTGDAIGLASELLQAELNGSTQLLDVTALVGRPEQATGETSGKVLNLFLYQVAIDGSLHQITLAPGQNPPIWLRLSYLLTAFAKKESDTLEAQKLLGAGMRVLQGLNFMRSPDAGLAENPSPLKITFTNANVELLSSIMQGSDEKYRLSVSFDVSPVMIAFDELPDIAPLVTSIGPTDSGPDIYASLGPSVTEVDPVSFEAGDTLIVRGSGLNSEVEEVCIGSQCLPISGVRNSEVQVEIPTMSDLCAGSQAITVTSTRPSGLKFRSNGVVATLRPKIETATFDVTDLVITGAHLGSTADSIILAVYDNGEVVETKDLVGTDNQSEIRVPKTSFAQAGAIQLILIVNGAQASHCPSVVLP